jgi:thiamine kinase
VAKKLPAANSLRGLIPENSLNRAVQACAELADAQLLEEIGQGLTNHSYLLQLSDRKVVLRVNSASSDVLGIDRQQELAALQHVVKVGLAPPLVYADSQNGFLITDYVEAGEALSHYADRKQLVAEMANWLKRLHSQQVAVGVQDYRSLVNRYWQQIDRLGVAVSVELREMREQMDGCQQWLADTSGFCFCHHDLVPGNVLATGGGLVAIDWEYACIGHPLFDLATVIESWQLNDDEMLLLMDSYGVDEQQTLDQMRIFYRYLELLWTALNKGVRVT